MRRITIAAMSTLSGLVLLFSYPTSRNADTAAASGSSAVVQQDSSAASSDTSTSAQPSAEASTEASTGATESSDDSTSTSDDNAAASESSTASSGSTSGSTNSSGAKAYLGEAINTRYGPVQVQIEVAGGKITSSNVTQVPWNDHRDQEINGRAVPILNQSAVKAQSTDFDSISGATFTSEAYKESLQSAIDKAGI